MNPFVLPRSSNDLHGQFLDSEALRTTLPVLGEAHLRHILRVWVMQGIPYAFAPSPMLYEALREWLAPRLGVAPLDIALIGSARTGYSWAPEPQFSKAFSGRSDLDLAVISSDLFGRVRSAFLQWQDDCDLGKVLPDNRYQEASLTGLPKNLARGFIDPNKVPIRYQEIRKVQEAMFFLTRKLGSTPGAPPISKASIRVYETREAFERQLLLNLRLTQQSLKNTSAKAN